MLIDSERGFCGAALALKTDKQPLPAARRVAETVGVNHHSIDPGDSCGVRVFAMTVEYFDPTLMQIGSAACRANQGVISNIRWDHRAASESSRRRTAASAAS